MKLSSLNEWLTLAANIGVLAGIIFLGIEMQQNTEMMRAQTRQAVTGNSNAVNSIVGGDLMVASTVIEGFRGDFEPMDPGEVLLVNSIFTMNLRNAENELYQHEIGLLDDDEYLPRLAWLKTNLAFPGPRRIWERTREHYTSDFQIVVDEIIDEVAEIQD